MRGSLPSLPLKHYYRSRVILNMENSTKDTFMIPLIVCDKSKTNPYDEVTDPYHPDYVGVKEHPMTYLGSEVDKIRVGLNFALHTGVESAVSALNFQTMLVAHSFDDYELDDKNPGSSDTIGSLTGIKMHSGGNYMEPNWNGTDLTTNDLFANATTYFSLATDNNVESIGWERDDYEDAVRQSTLKKPLAAATPGGLQWHTIYKDRPFALQDRNGKGMWFDVPGKVKRQNQYTFFGLLIHVPQVGSGIGQFYRGDEIASTDHLNVGFEVYFNEKNSEFSRT